jgi:transcriptional regulator with XRE-family HTH domain
MKKTLITREYKVFLRLLREARVQAALTQEELSQRLDATQSFVSKCERGERRLDLVELRTWCLALGVSVKAFAESFERQTAGLVRPRKRAKRS